MVLVLVYWIYLFWLFGVYGTSTQRLFGTKLHPVVSILLGAFTIAICSSIFSLFGGLNFYFELGLMGVSILLFITNICGFQDFLLSLYAKISELSSFSKMVLIAFTILCGLKSASIPFLIDNESYYLQTIQWLDSYGLVRGVANLHPFLMQFSGWHILQSATNLDFTGLPINDLSGFVLLLGLYYSIEKMNTFFNSKMPIYLYAGFFLLFSVFVFQFISVPSPDVAVYVLGLIIFFECYLWSRSYERKVVKLCVFFVLAVFAVYVKLTALLLVLIPVGAYFYTKKLNITNDDGFTVVCSEIILRKRNPAIGIAASISIITGIIFLLKNHIISGYAFFPLPIALGNPNWRVAQSILEWYAEQTHLDAFQTQSSSFFEMSFTERFTHWITHSSIDGIFNKVMILILAVFPIVLWRKRWNRLLVVLYVLSLLQFVLIWNNAPQFRFFFVFFMLLLSIAASLILTREWIIKAAVVAAVIITSIPILFPIQIAGLSATSFLANLQPFQWEHFLLPHPNTRYPNLKYKSVEFGNITLQTPIESEFFWATGDCEVPCVNIEQLEYFKEFFDIIPRQRTKELSDGFYAKQLKDE